MGALLMRILLAVRIRLLLVRALLIRLPITAGAGPRRWLRPAPSPCKQDDEQHDAEQDDNADHNADDQTGVRPR
jgi:hypothetical protein